MVETTNEERKSFNRLSNHGQRNIHNTNENYSDIRNDRNKKESSKSEIWINGNTSEYHTTNSIHNNNGEANDNDLDDKSDDIINKKYSNF